MELLLTPHRSREEWKQATVEPQKGLRKTEGILVAAMLAYHREVTEQNRKETGWPGVAIRRQSATHMAWKPRYTSMSPNFNWIAGNLLETSNPWLKVSFHNHSWFALGDIPTDWGYVSQECCTYMTNVYLGGTSGAKIGLGGKHPRTHQASEKPPYPLHLECTSSSTVFGNPTTGKEWRTIFKFWSIWRTE